MIDVILYMASADVSQRLSLREVMCIHGNMAVKRVILDTTFPNQLLLSLQHIEGVILVEGYCSVIIWSIEDPSFSFSWDTLHFSPLIDPVARACYCRNCFLAPLWHCCVVRLLSSALQQQCNNYDLTVR